MHIYRIDIAQTLVTDGDDTPVAGSDYLLINFLNTSYK